MSLGARSLEGLRMLIPRPGKRGASLQHQIEAHGGQARCIPALMIEPATRSGPAIAALGHTAEADLAIFTSVNAVEHWQGCHPPIALPSQILAVGEATAAALHRAGISGVVLPSQHDTDGLLAATKKSDARDVLLVTGQHGRPALRAALQRLGRLRLAEVYARRPHPDLAERLEALAGWPNVILASSAETYDALINSNPRSRAVLLQCPVVAPSERVIQHIRTLGSSAPAWQATPFGDATVLNALQARWVRPPPPSARDDDRERR